MKFENFLASRILSYKRYKNSISSPIIKISVLSIIIAISVINFSVSIGFGIQNEIKNKFSLISGDFYITNFKNESFSTFHSINLDQIDFSIFENEKFNYINKVIYNPGIIPLENNFQDIIFKGIESSNKDFLNPFIAGISNIDIKINDIIISDYLSNKLEINVGDKTRFLFFKNKDSKIPIIRNFNVIGLYNSGISEFDSKVVIGNINQSASINKWNINHVGALEISLHKNNPENNISSLFKHIPSSLDIQTSSQRFPDIFSWINLFDTNIYLIIILMTLVGGINMITALLVTVLDKTKLIAILKIFGTKNSSVKKIFFINGFYLILRGVFWGNLFSLTLMFFQKQFLFFKLDPSIYYSSFVPIEIDPFKIIFINLIVVLISLIMLFIPINAISKIKPNSTLKLS